MNVRATYNRFPAWTQFFWTWFTGMPNGDEAAPFVTSTWAYLAVSSLVFFGGIAASMAVMLTGASPAWLILSIAATLNGSRLLVLTIAHQCAHNMFARGPALNEAVHDAISTVVLSQDYRNYRADHLSMHHGIKTFGSFHDPVLDFIRSSGLVEGLTKRQLWSRMWLMFVLPKFHWRYFHKRLRSNFLLARPRRIALSVVWWSGLATLVALQPHLLVPVLVAYVLPITLLYHISAFLELICEHVWMRPLEAATRSVKIAELCWGRFCGDPVPQGYDAAQWTRWILRMTFYHLPSRLLVLAGDAPQHDYHHVNPKSPKWTISAYDRRDGVLAGRCDHLEVWGLFAAIDQVFDFMASAQESEEPATRLEYLQKII